MVHIFSLLQGGALEEHVIKRPDSGQAPGEGGRPENALYFRIRRAGSTKEKRGKFPGHYGGKKGGLPMQ